MKIRCLGVLLILTSGIISCDGAGRLGFARDGYCFNDRDGVNNTSFDPIPVELEDRNYRKATFTPVVSQNSQGSEDLDSDDQNPTQEDLFEDNVTGEGLTENQEADFLTFFASSRYSHGDLNTRIEEKKKRDKENAEKWRRELAKVYPLSSGEYQYVGAEIYTTERMPQIVSQNKDRRIYISHVKTKEGEFVFANNCMSNMPKAGGFAPINAEALTGFRVIGNEVFNESTSSYSIEFEDLKIKASVNKNEKPAFASPKEFLGKSEVKYQLYKLVNPGNLSYTHELRAYQKQGSVNIYTRTFYKFIPPKKADETKASK